MLTSRIANEARIKQKQDEYLDIIKHFKNDGLLDRFSYFTDIENRLGRLFIWRDVVLAIVGGPLTSDQWKFNSAEDNLRWATEQYAKMVWEWGCEKKVPSGELAFYDWLVKEGFIKVDASFKLSECFGVYEGNIERAYYYKNLSGEVTTKTETVNTTVHIVDLGQGGMKVQVYYSVYEASGSISAQGSQATFTAKSTVVDGAETVETTGNGTIRKVDNKYTLTGKVQDKYTNKNYPLYLETVDFTFNNLVKR